MEDCSKYHEKIIFYDDLSDGEKEILQTHLQACESCSDDFSKINSILKSLNQGINSLHPDNERLVRFIIFEKFPNEPDFDREKLSSEEVISIRKHIKSCQVCNDKYYEMKSEYESLEHFIEESNIPDYQLGTGPVKIAFSERFSQFIKNLVEAWKSFILHPKPKYVFAPAVAVAILLLLFVIYPLFNGGEVTYQSLAKLQNKQITYLTRSSRAGELQQGISNFNDGQYGKSIRLLEGFIASNPDHSSRVFAEYLCGLAYLYSVNNSADDLRPVQEQIVDKAIRHLQTSLSLNTNLRIQEESAWFLGKAYLMKRDAATAVEYFEKVRNLRGKYYQQSQEILEDVKNNLISSK